MKIKHTQIKEVRDYLAQEQNGCCAICRLPLGKIAPFDPVLDHCHLTGAVRGVLHRCCNAVLGKIENGAKRYGLRRLLDFARGLEHYLQHHTVNQTGLIHPTHQAVKRPKKRIKK